LFAACQDNHNQLARRLDEVVAALGSKPNHSPGVWPVPRGIRSVRPLADPTSIGGATGLRRRGSAATLAACHAVLGDRPRI
jgi:hypothetical protein